MFIFILFLMLELCYSIATAAAEQDVDKDTENTALMTAEEKAVGTVALKVYKAYWLAIGGCLAFTILLFVVLMQSM